MMAGFDQALIRAEAFAENFEPPTAIFKPDKRVVKRVTGAHGIQPLNFITGVRSPVQHAWPMSLFGGLVIVGVAKRVLALSVEG